MGSDKSEGDGRKTVGTYVLSVVPLAFPGWWSCLQGDVYLPCQQILSVEVYPTISGRKVLSDEKLRSIEIDGQCKVNHDKTEQRRAGERRKRS